MESGTSGYTRLLKQPCCFCWLSRIMKSPGTLCAAAIVMFDHLTSKVRGRLFCLLFFLREAWKLEWKSCQRIVAVRSVVLYFNYFSLERHFNLPTLNRTFLIRRKCVIFFFFLFSCWCPYLIWLFFTTTWQFSRYDFSRGVTLKSSCRQDEKDCGKRRQMWWGGNNVFAEERGLWAKM